MLDTCPQNKKFLGIHEHMIILLIYKKISLIIHINNEDVSIEYKVHLILGPCVLELVSVLEHIGERSW